MSKLTAALSCTNVKQLVYQYCPVECAHVCWLEWFKGKAESRMCRCFVGLGADTDHKPDSIILPLLSARPAVIQP